MRFHSGKFKLFQVDFPDLGTSKVIISVSKPANADLKIIMNGLKFQNSYWTFNGGNIEIFNCHTASMVLELKHISHAIVENCTFGNWTFTKVQNAVIKNCYGTFDEGISTTLLFINSSAYVENMTIENEIMTGHFYGIWLYYCSLLHIEGSKIVNNTVREGIIYILKSCSLIMLNCTVEGNQAIEHPSVIHANKSFVHIEYTYFNGNIATKGGGAIVIAASVLQIKNATFKNSRVDRTFGVGGAILSLNNSLLDFSDTIFNHNKADQGGAIYHSTGKVKLNQCSFFGNSENAIVNLDSDISIVNTIF